MPRPVVVLDLGAGEAHVGGTTVAVSARPGGALAVGDQVIRPLSFGERWRLLDGTAGTGRSGGAGVGAAVLACAGTRPPGATAADGRPADDAIRQVLALHLAGARPERTVPWFGHQLARLTAADWTPRDVLDADADLVDLLTVVPDGDGWRSIVLTADGPAPGSVIEVLNLLERDLVGRLTTTAPDEDSAAAQQPASRQTPDGWSGSSKQPAAERAAGAEARVDEWPGEPSHRTGVTSHRLPTPAPSNTPTQPGAAVGPAPLLDATPAPRAVGARRSAPDATSAPVGPVPDPADIPPTWIGTAFPTPIRAATTVPVPTRTHAAGFENHSAGTLPLPAPIGFRSAHRAVENVGAPAGRVTLTDSSTAPTVVHPDPVRGRAAPVAAAEPARPDAFDIADRVAALLDEESDLRGLRR